MGHNGMIKTTCTQTPEILSKSVKLRVIKLNRKHQTFLHIHVSIDHLSYIEIGRYF